MVRASIDIGSNSTLLLIGNVTEDGVETLESESRVTGLGRDIDKNNRFLDIAMDDTSKALGEYVEIANSYQIKAQDITITATEASRVAENASSFFSDLKAKYGINIQTISGEGEAYFSTKGILLDHKLDKDIVIMDIGGASTELISVGVDGKIKNSVSFPIGSVRASSWLAKKSLDQELDKFLGKYKSTILSYATESIVCVAGTMTSVANIYLDHGHFVEKNIHNQKLNFVDLKFKFKELNEMSHEEILKKYPFLGKRHQSIQGGAQVASLLLDLLGVKDILISTYGLRYGTIIEGGIPSGLIFRR